LKTISCFAKHHLKLTALLAAASMQLACHSRQIDARPHERLAETNASAPTTQDNRNQQVLVSGLDVGRPLGRLSQDLFKAENLTRPDFILSAEARNLLQRLNAEILNLSKKSVESDELKSALNVWRSALLAGCNEQLQGCRHIGFFRSDSQSQAVLLEIAKRESQPDVKLKLLHLGFDLGNRASALDFENQYVKAAVTFLKQSQNGPRSETFERMQTQVEAVIETILLKGSDQARSQALEPLLELFPIWQSSLKESSGDQHRLRMLIFDFALQSRIYNKDRNDLHPDLRAALKDRQERANSLTQQLTNLRKQSQNLTWMKLPESLPHDEYLYLVDAVVNDHINIDQAARFWEGTHRDLNQLATRARDVVRILILNQLRNSNAHLRRFFQRKDMFSSATFIDAVISESTVLSQQWERVIASAELLKTLVERVNLGVDRRDANTNEFLTEIQGLRRNVKYFAVWPSMFVMSYHLSKMNFKVKFESPFGSVTVNSADVMTALFDGELTAWLNFGNDGIPLNKAEVNYAFSFAVSTGVLRDFGVSNEEFLSELVRRYLAPTVAEVDFDNQTLASWTTQNAKYNQLMRVCRSPVSEFTNRIPLGSFPSYVYHGSASNGATSNSEILYISSQAHRTELDSQIEAVSLILIPRERQVRALIEMIHAANQNSAERAQLSQIVDQALVGSHRFMGLVFHSVRELGPCIHTMRKRELQQQIQLIQAEAAYLRDVHAQMTALRRLSANQRPAAAEAASAKMRLVPSYIDASEIPRIGGFDSEILYYNRLDGVLRMAAFLQRGYRGTGSTHAAINPSTEIVIPEDVLSPDLGFSSRTVNLNYRENVDEFVGQALKLWIASSGPFAFWWNSFMNTFQVRFRLEALTALYRAGSVQMIDPVNNVLKSTALQPEEIFTELFRLAELVELSSDDRQIAQLINLTGRFAPNDLAGLYRETNSLRERGLLDGAVLLLLEGINGEPSRGSINTSEEGATQAIYRYALIPWGRVIYQQQKSIGTFYLPVPEATRAIVGDLYRPLVQTQLRRRREFLRAAQERVKQGASTQVNYSLDLNPVGLAGTLISPNVQQDVLSQEEDLHRETDGFFRLNSQN